MGELIRLRLLGGFALEYRGSTIELASQRMQALVAYLALHRAEVHSRQHLAFLLWPLSSESQAHTNLRTLLHRLQSAFPDAHHVFLITSQTIEWQPTVTLAVDVDEFEQAVNQIPAIDATGGETDIIAALEQSVSRYTGDLLPDCYDEWLIPERERLRMVLFIVLEQLVARLEQNRRYREAILNAHKLVQLDPLNEVTSLTLMRLYTLTGDRASALRVYHRVVSALRSEYGTAPSEAIQAAYERLLAAETPSVLEHGFGSVSDAQSLVGRDREWKRMLVAWQDMAAGQPRLLMLSGEAGIGKTRLAEDLIRWAERQGHITAVARCYAAEGDLAYAPVTELLRAAALQPAIARLDAAWLTELARLTPNLAAIQSTGTMGQQAVSAGEQGQRLRLFEALSRAILSSSRPVLLLVDDLQWADRDSLEWLHFLLRYQSDARLLVIGTVRMEEVTADHPLIPLLQMIRRERRGIEIALEPLTQEQTTELAQNLLGRTFNPETAAKLYVETEGNPLFVVETVRAELNGQPELHNSEPDRASGSALASEAPVLPPTIQAVIAWRLDRLSPAAQSALEVAAVIGRSFAVGVLARAVDLDEDNTVRALDELWQQHIIREQSADTYDFTHGKLRTVAYTRLNAARLRLLHRRVAQALEQEYASELNGFSAQIAAHYEQAGLTTEAASFYRRAAGQARHVYAHEAAIAYYRRALALLKANQHAELVSLFDQLGETLHFIGRYDEARDAWMRALESVPEAQVLTGADLYRKLGNAWRDQYQYEEALRMYDAAETVLRRPGAADDADFWRCWGQLRIERANVHYWLGEPSAMLELIREARDAFDRYGTALERARVHQLTSIALLRSNRYSASAQAIEHSRTHLNLLHEAGETAFLAAAHFQYGFVLLWAGGDLSEVDQEMRTALMMAQQSGDVSLETRCLTYLTVVARLGGETDAVRGWAERSLRVAENNQMPEYVGAAHGNLAWLAWRTDDTASAWRHAEEAIKVWNQQAPYYMFQWIGRLPRLALALAEGNVAEALEEGQVLLDERQQRMPPAIELALNAAICANASNDRAACAMQLQAALMAAQDDGYL